MGFLVLVFSFSSNFSCLREDLGYIDKFATFCWLPPELCQQAHITSMTIKCFQHSLRKQAFFGEYVTTNKPPDFFHKRMIQ